MHQLFSAAFAVVIFSACFFAQAAEFPNGFVVWAEGSGCDRELKFNRIKGGVLGPRQTAVKKGPGADIWVVISNDGKWIAFGRAIEYFKARYGICDYHSYNKFDITIARIDGALPAEPIKIGQGYWPSWGDDSHQPVKTLYFTKYSDQTIQKTTILPDGSFTKPVQHAVCPKKMSGTNAHTQMAPNGRYIALRPAGIKVWDVKEEKYIEGAAGSGEHPCWGPRSKYLIWSHDRVCRIENGRRIYRGKAGLGKYWFGISNDSYFDEGKLWIIGCIGGAGQNNAGSVEFKEVDISGGGWKVGERTKVGEGTSADIHVFGRGTGTILPGVNQTTGSGLPFTTQIRSSAYGLQLIISSRELAGYSAGLYDLLGMRRAFIPLSVSPQNSMPLQGIADGRYVLKIESGDSSIWKGIWILR